MSGPIIPSRDPLSPMIPQHEAKPIQPGNPEKFTEILEEKRSEDFLGIKLTPQEKKMVWATILQQITAQIKIEQDNMMEELREQQRKIENPDE